MLVKSQPAAGGQNAGGTPAPQPFDQPTQPISGQGTEALAGQRSPAAGDDDLCEQLLASLRPLLKAPLTAVLCAREELQIQSDGAKKRQEAETELRRLEGELKQKLLQTRS